VVRQRLTDALKSGSEAPGTFMMLSAPAGYGKTVLLAQWAEQNTAAGTLTAWATLTRDDRDPLVLWTTIIDSLMTAADDVNTTLAAALANLVPGMAPREHSEMLAAFTAALDEHGARIALIVDDTHALERSEAEREFVRLLQMLPDNVTVAFATRTPLHAHRTRVSGRLVELTADALSFTTAETSDFFADRVPIEGITALHKASDGWPAALSLALLSIERLDDPAVPAVDLLKPEILHDYLHEEVYRDLSDRERAVLLATAISPATTAELVTASIEEADSGTILRELAERNRLVHRSSTDGRGRVWYAVQPLFGAFLRERLAERDPGKLSELVRRAAMWQADNSDPVAALELALSFADPELADRILRQRGYDMVGDARAQALLGRVSSSDPALAHPFGRLMLAYAAVAQGNTARARVMLAPLRLVDLGADDLIEWDWLHYLVLLFVHIADKESTAGLSPGWPESTLEDVPSGLRLAVQMARGFARTREGEGEGARNDLVLALSIAEARDDLRHRVMSTVGLATIAAADFNVHETRALCERALALATALPGCDLAPTRAVANALAGWSSLELLDSAAARGFAEAAVVSAASQSDPDVQLLAGHVLDAATFDSTPQKRHVAQDFVSGWPPPYLEIASTTGMIVSLHFGIRMAATLKEHRWSERLLERARQRLGENYDWQVAFCRFLLHAGRDGEIPSALAPLLADDRSDRCGLSDVVAWSLEAVVQGDANNAFRAHAALCRALQRADETGGYLDVTSVGARRVVPLLYAGIDRFGPQEHVARALRAGWVGDGVLNSGPLTERESQVLEELRTLRTVEEIAHDILLSPNTVKTHMRSIYRKLDVTSRRRAVARAEEMGLL